MGPVLLPRILLGAHGNIFISLKSEEKEWISFSLDYIFLYTNAVTHYNFKYIFVEVGAHGSDSS